MEGAGILTMIVSLLFAPFEMMRTREQKRRLLTPHELNLRLATRPLGVAALVAGGVWLFGGRNVSALLAPVFLRPSDNWLPAALLGGVLLFSLASFIVGASQCWGARSDRMLPVWAFFELAVGGVGLRFLWLWNLDLARALDVAPRMAALWLLLATVSIWCVVVGAARFGLVTVGGGSALRQMTTVIAARNAPMIAVPRHRPWWKFWKFW